MEMMKTYGFLLASAAAAILVSACGKSETSSSNGQSLEYIEAWVKHNYPQAEKSALGTYILEDTPGSGDTYNGEAYAFVTYTVSSMNGTISSTTDEKIAKQLGTYNKSYYYGENVWYTADDNLAVGIEDAIRGMKAGENRKVLIPSWLLVLERKDNPEDYFKKTNSSYSTCIYDVTLHGFTDNIIDSQIARIEEYNREKYGQLDSLTYGFYYKELKAPSDTTAFRSDTTININYTGRLLNGQVFDTTIRDTAKKYNIYDSAATYSPAAVVWGENAESIKIRPAGSSTASAAITGFQYLMWNMRRHGKSVGIFVSPLGYGTRGSGSQIPGYAPLVFEVEIVD